jgi:hypothetical protein
MVQRVDNLQTLIEQLAFYVARIIGAKSRNDYSKAMALVEEGLRTLTQIDESCLETATSENINDLLLNRYKVDPENLIVIAELLFEQAEIFSKTNETEKSLSSLHKSLAVFEYIDKREESPNIDRNHKIDKIKEMLAN